MSWFNGAQNKSWRIFAARVRDTTGGYVFTYVCLFIEVRGYPLVLLLIPILAKGGTTPSRDRGTPRTGQGTSPKQDHPPPFQTATACGGTPLCCHTGGLSCVSMSTYMTPTCKMCDGPINMYMLWFLSLCSVYVRTLYTILHK